MKSTIRKNHTASFKLKVALEAIKGQKTSGQICSEFGVSSSQVSTWKKHLENDGAQIFADKRNPKNQEETVEKLHAKIGKLTVENDFLAKVLGR
jgi:transposase